MRAVVLLLIGGCGAPDEGQVREAPGARGGLVGARLIGSPRLVVRGAPEILGFGTVAAAGDLNGDGFGDVIVGSPDTADQGVYDQGALQVHYGGAAGLDPVAAVTLWGDRDRDRLGSAITVGDFDGDGFDDLAAADDGDWGDPYPDRVIDRIPVWLGGPAGIGVEPDQTIEDDTLSAFGWAVASGGDLNGDGYDDLLVGDTSGPAGGTYGGRVVVYHGGPDGLGLAPALELLGEDPSDAMGRALVIVGDVDGDGYDDAALTVPGADDGGPNGGKVQIHHGGPDGLEATPRTEIVGASWADEVWDLTAAGDLDGDGHADLLIGKPYGGSGYEGQVDLHLGGPAGLDPAPAVTIVGSDLGGLEVTSTHGIGDFDEDGFDDVVFKFDPVPQDAAAALFLGAPKLGIDLSAGFELFDVPNVILESNFGQWVLSTDVDGDGHLDLFVTDPYADVGGGVLAGGAYVFAGNEDSDLDGYGALDECDDRDPTVNPAAVEVCDGVDQDCDGELDDGAGIVFEADRDEDGFTDPDDSTVACPDPPEGYAAPSELPDCDDQDPTRHPWAEEVPGDGVDQDCDGEDASAPGDGTAEDPPAGDEEESGKAAGGCGCASGGAAETPALAVLALVLAGRARSARRVEPRVEGRAGA